MAGRTTRFTQLPTECVTGVTFCRMRNDASTSPNLRTILLRPQSPRITVSVCVSFMLQIEAQHTAVFDGRPHWLQ